MPWDRHAVGSDLYVWTKRRQRGAGHEMSAVLSAHGTKAPFNFMPFAYSETTLHYYTPDGTALLNPGLKRMTEGLLVPVESLNARKSLDYILLKFESSRVRENYSFLQKWMDRDASGAGREKYESLAPMLRYAGEADIPPDAALMAEVLEDAPFRMDIITLRRRRGYNPMYLSSVMQTLQKAGYKYGHIHCSFCRVGLWDAIRGELMPSREDAKLNARAKSIYRLDPHDIALSQNINPAIRKAIFDASKTPGSDRS